VSRILDRFVDCGILEIQRDGSDGLIRSTSTYRLTLDSPSLHKLMHDTFEQQRRDIELEKGLRRERRDQRRKQRAEALHTKVKSFTSLHPGRSDDRFVTTHTKCSEQVQGSSSQTRIATKFGAIRVVSD
jgi:hypothetical protein